MLLIEKLMPWGPVFFGLLIFAPMWAAVLEAAGLTVIPGDDLVAAQPKAADLG